MQRGQGKIVVNLSNNDLSSLLPAHTPHGKSTTNKKFQWSTGPRQGGDTPMKMPRSRSAGGLKSLVGDFKPVPTKVKDIRDEEVTELRRQNSANSLRCLAMACTPKRGDGQGLKRSAPERNGSSTGLRRSPPGRTASSTGLRRSPPGRTASATNIDLGGRKVIRSNSNYSSGRVFHTKEEAPGSTVAVKTGIPGSIRIDRRRSCGGRLNSSLSDDTPRVSSSEDTLDDPHAGGDDDDSSCSSMDDASSIGDASIGDAADDEEDDDDSSCSSSDSSSLASEDYDLATSLWSQESAPLKIKQPARSKKDPMRWRKDDGTFITEATPEELQRTLNEGINIAVAAGSRATSFSRSPQGRKRSFGLDASRRTAASSTGSAANSECSSMQITVVYQPAPKPWVCICDHENDHDYKYCGMCATPQVWTCSTCQFERNRCRNVCCGGCGARRNELSPAA